MEKQEKKNASPADQTGPSGTSRKSLKIILPLLVLIIAIAVALYISSTAPKAQRTLPVRETPLVKTIYARHSSQRIVVPAMGSVIPAREITLKSQVAGNIVKINPRFTEGGYLKTGEKLLKIDDQDYRLAVTEQHSAIVNAEYSLKLELGRQDVAKREWELLGGDDSSKAPDSELALRKPHLEKAQADVASARAAMKRAELDLARTTVRTPFNCIVRTKKVDLGSHVSSQDQLAELVGTDMYHVRASVPIDRLKWISIPHGRDDHGSKVLIIYGNGTGYERRGSVVRLLADLEEEGRMARILIAVKDPLDLKSPENNRPPLLIGEYVRVEIEGPELDGVVALPRSAMREGRSIWIADEDDTLDIRRMDILWRGEETVLIKNSLADGERIIVTDLSTPIQGMKVMVSKPADTSAVKTPEPKIQQ
ncbi:MAG: efflux RND transporter periplasmic adaptor subunit [Deltaproteobacteria bacterium]|nr:efflux RND transporter periplasmic adaptor subunit [Deltaproteobacteria bacterium]